MSRWDWIVVLPLAAAGLLLAWPDLRESNLGMVLTGRRDGWTGGHRMWRWRGWHRAEAPEGRDDPSSRTAPAGPAAPPGL